MKSVSKLALTSGSLLLIVAGIILTLPASSIIEHTNTDAFCISCHEMRSTVYEEFKGSPHDLNKNGIKATCASCHVPNQTLPKLAAKIRALKDVYHHLEGTIDSPEKFEEKRLVMAERVWEYYVETDSANCRSCHDTNAMEFDEQQGRAKRKHKDMVKNGGTCIDCHKGIAHDLPEDYL